MDISTDSPSISHHISDIIQELKRIQIEYGDLPVQVKDSTLGVYSAFPNVEFDIDAGQDVVIF